MKVYEGNNLEHTAADLSGGVKYSYKVRAYTNATDGSVAYGPYSTVVSVRPAPEAPTKVQAYEHEDRGVKSDAKRVYLSWEASEGATSYGVYYELSDGQKKLISTVKNKPAEDGRVYATIKGLKYDTQYTFYVTAGANKAYGEYSEPSNAIRTQLHEVPDFTANHYSSSSLKLKWTTLPDVSGYEIEKREEGESTWARIKSLSSKYASYTAGSLKLGDKYDFRIRGYVTVDGEREYMDGDGGWTELESSAYTRPSKVSNFRGVANGSDFLRVKWSAMSGADGYVVYWREKADTDAEYDYAVIKGGDVEYTIEGLESYTNYYIYVRAYVEDPSEENQGTKTSTITRRTTR